MALSDHRGKVVVVTFWASWCAPCQKELGVLDAMHAHRRPQQLDRLIGDINAVLAQQ